MIKVIDQLTVEHQIMLQLFKELHKEGVASHLGRMKLLIAEDWLIRHLEREEVELYPKVWEFTEATEDTPPFLANLQDDLLALSLIFLDFFQKLNQGLTGKDLQDAFERLQHLLAERIHYEETYIFPVLKQMEMENNALYPPQSSELLNKYFRNETPD